MLRRRAILAVLYKNHIVDGNDFSWESLLSEEFSFLEYITDLEPQKSARQLMDGNDVCFRKFCPQDFSEDGLSPMLPEMNLRCPKLADAVKTCLIAHSGLLKPIIEVTKVGFYPSPLSLLIRDSNTRLENLFFWKGVPPKRTKCGIQSH